MYNEDYDRDYERNRDRERDRDRDRDRDYDRDRDRDYDRDRDRDYDRDYHRPPLKNDCTDDDIRNEIDRLRGEISNLKRSLEDRKAENNELRKSMKASDQANYELLTNISKSLEALGVKIDGLDSGIAEKFKKYQESARDDFEELNLPIESKCASIEEKIKALQSNLDYNEPLKEQIDGMTEAVKETLAERFGSKTIGDVLKKEASISTFIIANTIGIVVLLALMCFFIISLMS